jgi:general secretion pathway protein F
MIHYHFQVLKPGGQIVRGTLIAKNEHDARQQLTQDGSVLLTISARKMWASIPQCLQSAGSVQDLMKQLSLMTGAALPLRESLLSVAKQQHSPRLLRVLNDVYSQICQGVTLSRAMAQHKRYFDPLCCAVTEAGELSGDLATAFRCYSVYLDKQQTLRSSVRQALSYPLILLCVSFMVITVLLTVAVPKIVSQLSISGVALPWSTRLVLWLGEALDQHLPLILALLTGGMLIILWLSRKQAVRMRSHQLLLNLPVAGRLLFRVQQVRLLMTLSILSMTAVPMANALHLASMAVSNLWLREKAVRAVQSLTEGASLTQAIEKEALLPARLVALLHAGEMGGRLDEVLNYLATVEQEALQQRLISLVKLLEPLFIFILGGVVLLIFMAIIQPMLTMNSLNI